MEHQDHKQESALWAGGRRIGCSFIQAYGPIAWEALDAELAPIAIHGLTFQFVEERGVADNLDAKVRRALQDMIRVRRFEIGLYADDHFPDRFPLPAAAGNNPFRCFADRTIAAGCRLRDIAGDARVTGAYIAGELHNDPMDEPPPKYNARLRWVQQTLADLVKALRSQGWKSVSISGFVNDKPRLGPDQAATVFTCMLQNTGIDHFYFQTGCGTILDDNHPDQVKLPIERLPLYLARLQRAFNDHPGMPQLAIDVELYQPRPGNFPRRPASLAFVKQQLEAVPKGMIISSFATPHYMTNHAQLVYPQCAAADTACRKVHQENVPLAHQLYAAYQASI